MGDRTYATFRLGGHVETIDELDEIVRAIIVERVEDQLGNDSMNSESRVQAALRRCIETNESPSFYGQEVNYGIFDDIEAVLVEVPGLGAHFSWEHGGGYESGMKTVLPNGDEYGASGGDGAAIPLTDLTKARAAGDPLAAIDALIADARAAEGGTLPPFTVSPAVAAYLKIFAAKAA